MMSDMVSESIVLPAVENQEIEQIPPGMSRRAYWKMVSNQAHPTPDSSSVVESAVPSTEIPLDGAIVESQNVGLPENASPLQPAAAQVSPPPPQNGLPPELPPEIPYRPRRRLKFPHMHFGPPFWTIASVLSLLINIILILVMILLARQIFGIKNALQDQLIGGLYKNFAKMDQASIKTTIPIHTTVPAKFDLPLNTVTTVVLQKEVLLKNARVVSLTTGGLSIFNAPADITLPAGTQLPVSLNLIVPVDQQIPVDLNVVVDIPLNQTELHAPFVGLQNVVGPYKLLLDNTPATLQDAVCGPDGSDFCKWMIP